MGGAIRRAGRSGALLVAVGALAWATGRPFVFPSLGPSAYVLATRPGAPESRPRRVLGGHAIGVVAGLLAHHAIAPGLVVTAPLDPLAPAPARLAAAGVASVALTTGGMLATDWRHAPACATTLIVSLGLLPTLVDGGIILLAVGVLLATHRLFDVPAAAGEE